jgi:hypothetical protein
MIMDRPGATAELAAELGAEWDPVHGVDAPDLAQAMNAVEGTETAPYMWDQATVETVDAASMAKLSAKGPWIAGMKGMETGAPGHAVVVRGLSPTRNVAIWDPLFQRSYELTLAEFGEYWGWTGIWRR